MTKEAEMEAVAEKPVVTCRECGELLIVTEEKAVLCPNGHGRVLWDVPQKAVQEAHKARKRAKWLQQFPLAERVTGRTYRLNGRLYRRYKPHGCKISTIKYPDGPECLHSPETPLAARNDAGIAFWIMPVKEKPEPKKSEPPF